MNPNLNPQSNQITLFCQTLTLLYASTYPNPNVDTLNTTTTTTTSHSLASFSTVYKLLHQHTTYNTTPLDYFDNAYNISSSPSSPKSSSKNIIDPRQVLRQTPHDPRQASHSCLDSTPIWLYHRHSFTLSDHLHSVSLLVPFHHFIDPHPDRQKQS